MKAWEITESGLYVDDRPEPCFWIISVGNKATAFGVDDNWRHSTYPINEFIKDPWNEKYNFERLM